VSTFCDRADGSNGALKSQALYAASQGVSFLIIALVFYIGSLWIIEGRITTAAFFTVLTSVVSPASSSRT
jgi:ATP-binding cassette subfamily B (MDR/TAP) protein 1